MRPNDVAVEAVARVLGERLLPAPNWATQSVYVRDRLREIAEEALAAADAALEADAAAHGDEVGP